MKMKEKPDAIDKMIAVAVEHLPDATAAFHSLVSAKADMRPALAERLHEIEREADERYVVLVRKVAGSFITPFDREDIYTMVEVLDDVVDALDHCAHLVVDLKFGKLPDGLVESAAILVEMSETCRAMVGFIKKPNKLEKLLFAANECENRLDASHRQLLVDTLQPGADPIRALRVKLLADLVEDAATKLELFTRAVSIVAIKET